jgi:exopolyphosphatase/guanosine-5'-triphosphate,3'-diphosphate pyrophosphatase
LTEPISVVDIGSNSGRIVVVEMHLGHLEVLADERVALRLASQIEDGALTEAAMERTVAAVSDFLAVGRAAGAQTARIVATAAVRESSNGEELARRVKEETGAEVEIVDGEREAYFAFLGASYGLGADGGFLLDIGGGSLELSHFKEREVVRSWTLPLGALRLSDRFLRSDPPSRREIDDLRGHVLDELSDAGVDRLASDERLIATGGTMRNLAKMDRRERSYVIPRVHGYSLTRRRVSGLVDRLAERTIERRGTLRGLNEDRADSIVGGALVAETVMEFVAASDVTVSGLGLREGIALHHFLGDRMPEPSEVRRASVDALTARFGAWNEERAERRASMVATLSATLFPSADRGLQEMLGHAARILDVGRSVDYYNRAQHAASIVLSADLAGFSHARLALVAILIRRAEDPSSGLKELRKLLGDGEAEFIAPASAVLAIADAIEHRLPLGSIANITCALRGRALVVGAPVQPGSWSAALGARVQAAFARTLQIEPNGGRA